MCRRWSIGRARRKALEEFLARMPFRVPLNAKVSAISAGERQKCEILKQLYLQRRFLILDEPTSVLTPGEADEVLGMLRGMVASRRSDHPDDHPQIPRGDGVRRRGDHPAARQARGAGARQGSEPRRHGAHHDRRRGIDGAAAAHRRVRRAAPRHRKAQCARRWRPAGGARRLALDPRRRDRRRRRRLRQRPAPAHRGSRRPARGRERRNLSAGRASITPRREEMRAQSSVGASRGAAEERLRRRA